jgi:hypothetical protein
LFCGSFDQLGVELIQQCVQGILGFGEFTLLELRDVA